MELINDFATPVELTGVARASLAEYEAAQGSLAAYLPNITSDSRVVRFSIAATGMNEIASYRSFDAEAAIGSGMGGDGAGIAELPPVSQKLRISELDLVDSQGANAPEARKNLAAKYAAATTRAVADAVEVLRGQALENGAISINDGGFRSSVDFGRDDELTVDDNTDLWSDPDTNILEAIDGYAATFSDANGGIEPTKIIVSRAVLGHLLKHPELAALVAGVASDANVAIPSRVSIEALNSSLTSFGLPTFEVYNRRVNKAGVMTPVLSTHKAIFVSDDTGRTVWGPTAEANEPGYGIAVEDRPGIAVGAYKTNDPIAQWVKAAATSLPILAAGNRSMSVNVIANP